MLTIVNYRFVHRSEHGRLAGAEGLNLHQFRGQLEYIHRRHSVVTAEEVMYAVQGSPADLPDDAALLTFEHGLADHYTTVLPLLEERGWQGVFLVASRPVLESRVLDMHKVEFVLRSAGNPQLVVDEIFELLEEYRERYDLPTASDCGLPLAEPTDRESAGINLVKCMLRHELPASVRESICSRLFARHVTADESAFAAELYMSLDQLRLMQRMGMHIGAHGETYCRLDLANPHEREREIRSCVELLGKVGADTESWSMAYPYGAHDKKLRNLLKSAGARIGFTHELARADLWRNDPLSLPRLDSHRVPKQYSSARIPVVVGPVASAAVPAG